MASGIIGALRITLGLDTAAFDRDTRQATTSIGRMQNTMVTAGRAITGAFAAIGIGSLVRDAFEMASALAETSEQVGVSVEALQELRFAAEQTGVGADTMEAAMKRLNKALGDLQLGKKGAVEAFAAINLSADELRGKRPEEALRMIADALNRLPDASQRVAIGQQLMGRSFSELLPLINGGSAALDEYAQTSREMGQISTEDAQKLDNLADQWDQLKTGVTLATANILADALPMLQQVGAWLDNVRQSVANFREAVIAGFNAATAAVRAFFNGVANWLGDGLRRIIDDAKRNIEELTDLFSGLGQRLRGWFKTSLVDGAGGEFMRMGNLMVGQAATVSVRVERTFRDMADATLNAFSKLTGAIKSGGFLSILEGVIGVGLQLGSIGAFGGKIATRINGAATVGRPVTTPRGSAGGTITINPSPYFDVVVDSRIGAAAPAIVRAGGQAGTAMAAQRSSRSLV